MRNNIPFGRLGESVAAAYALEHGYELIDRNVQTPHGEIDLILKRPDGVISFTEVKTRATDTFGYPEEAVNRGKLSHMIGSAAYYMENHYDDSVFWQLDIAAVSFTQDRKQVVEIKWIENVSAD